MTKDKSRMKSVQIQAKISYHSYEIWQELVKRGHFESTYELMQWVVQGFINYADGDRRMTDEQLELYAKMMEDMENSKNRIITTKPTHNNQLKMTDAIMIYSIVGRRGYVVRRASFNADSTSITHNEERALATLIRKIFPSLADKIEKAGEQMNEASYVRIINQLCNDELAIKPEHEDWAANEYGNVPKRTWVHSVNKPKDVE